MRTGNMRVSLFAILILSAARLHAVEIEPPKVQLTDKFGVNMSNGQVTHSMEIVSIGGAMGLSDSISIRGNEFDFAGYRGFNHKYYASAKNIELCPDLTCSPRNIMRVYDASGTADFAYYIGSTMQQSGTATTGYSYKSVGDERQILEVVGSELRWTKADGTEVFFQRSSGLPIAASAGGYLTKIVAPNGFTITVTLTGKTVTTNTGFQLKRVYDLNGAPGPAWSAANPKYVYGVNAAIEHCAWNANSCTFSNTWPRATFDWPAGMPLAMRSGTNSIAVTNAQGLKTTYGFTAYDLAYEDNGQVVPGFTPNTDFSPRMTSVSVPNSTSTTLLTYTYRNVFNHASNWFGGAFSSRMQTSGVVKTANRGSLQVTYDLLRPYNTDYDNTATAINGVSYVRLRTNVSGTNGAINYADNQEGRLTFELGARNFPESFVPNVGLRKSFTYTRGNLSKISYGLPPDDYSIEAEFPASCTASTRKTCNQATRMRDANGNWTDYTYHTESGQVATVTHPANKHGVRAQTRYTYQQKSAEYYGESGSWITGTPIWLKTAEEYCISGAASGNNCTIGGEVVTQYEYNHDNLLLTGMTVTADGTTRRTCYRYDKYGNQIGVTTPNANLGSCP